MNGRIFHWTLTIVFFLGLWAALTQLEGSLPECETEDSTHCYWDGQSSGNGLGQDIVSP